MAFDAGDNFEVKQAEDYGGFSKFSQLVYGKKLMDMIELKPTDNIAAIGCGTGELEAFVASKVPNGRVVAIDPDNERIKVAKEKFRDITNLTFHVGTASDVLQNKQAEFDAIYSNAVLHWIPVAARSETFALMFTALKPGGLTCHNIGNGQRLKTGEKLGVLLSKEDIMNAMSNLFPWTHQDLKAQAEKHGFDTVSLEDVYEENWFPSVEVYLTWFEATFQGLFRVKEKFYKSEPKLVLTEKEDGSVDEVTPLTRMILKKPAKKG